MFEFTVEYVQGNQQQAFVFGQVTKGVVREGYRLNLIYKDGGTEETICKAIAGLERRLFAAGGQGGETNVGILIGIGPDKVTCGDRLVSHDTFAQHVLITPEEWDFSILHGPRKVDAK
jgi:hypothetical protein